MKQWVRAVHVWEDGENEEEDCANTVRVALLQDLPHSFHRMEM